MRNKCAQSSRQLNGTDTGLISWASQGTFEQDLMKILLETSKGNTETTNKKTANRCVPPTPKQYEEIYLEMPNGEIQALSSDYEIQVSLTHPSSNEPDESSIFKDYYSLVGIIYSSEMLDEGAISKIRRLYFMLTRLNFESDCWTVEAMKNSPEWEAIRTLAKEVLEVTGGEISKPKPGWPVYD